MLGMHAHKDYLKQRGAPKTFAELAGHAIIGFDRDVANIRAMQRAGINVTRDMFTIRTDNDLASLNAIRAGCGIGICQIGLAKRDPNLKRLLPDLFAFPLETWIVMHEDRALQRGCAQCSIIWLMR